METKLNLNLIKSVEVKNTQATNQISADMVSIKMVVTPLKDGVTRITV